MLEHMSDNILRTHVQILESDKCECTSFALSQVFSTYLLSRNIDPKRPFKGICDVKMYQCFSPFQYLGT